MNKLIKTPKGTFQYVKKERMRVIIYTIILFGISLAIYFTGYITTGSNKNLLTIVAVLGCLPASKSAVNMIMFLRVKGCSSETYHEIKKHVNKLTNVYDLNFTTYEKTFQVVHLVIEGKNICGFSESSKCDVTACEKHIESLLKQDGKNDYTLKIFKDLSKYLERLDQLNKIYDSSSNESAIVDFLFQITL